MNCFTKKEQELINKVVGKLGLKRISLSEKIELINGLQARLNSNFLFQGEKIKLIEANRVIKDNPIMKLNQSEIKYGTKSSIRQQDLEYRFENIMNIIKNKNQFFEKFLGHNVNSIKRVKEAIEILKNSNNDGVIIIDKKIEGINDNNSKFYMHFTVKEKSSTIMQLEKAVEIYTALQAEKKSNKDIAIAKGGVITPLNIDGNKFLAIHSENEMRVFYAKSGKLFGIFPTEEAILKNRIIELNKFISNHLTKRFNDIENYPDDVRNMPQRIQQLIRNKYPINDDGTFHIARKIFTAREENELFSSLETPFTKLFELNTKGMEDEYENELNKIIEFMPTEVRDMLIGNKKGVKAEEFVDATRYFLAAMNHLEVPTEKTWNQKYILDDKGKYVTTNNSELNTPNYFELLGEFKKVEYKGFRNEDNEIIPIDYYELVLDKNIEEIVKFYTIKAMADMNKLISELSNDSDTDIAKKLNISASEVQKMRILLSQNILPASSFISDAASEAISQIGLSVNKNINMDIKFGLEATMASLIKNTMIKSNFVDYVSSKNAIEIEQLEAANKILSEGGTQTDIMNKFEQIQNKYKFKENNFSLFKLNKNMFGPNKNDYKKTFLAINKLKYISLNMQRLMPSTEEINTYSKTMIKSTYNINPRIETFIKKQQKIKWVFNPGIKNVYKEYQQIKKIKDKEQRDQKYQELLISFGYEVIDENSQQISRINKIIANNDKIEREFEILMNYYSNLKIRKGFYLPWGQVSNGRVQILSDMNPQESKLIRSFISQTSNNGDILPGHTYMMEAEDFNSESKSFQMMVFAISQGLDMDPDKNSPETILQDVRDQIFEIKDDKLILKGSSDTGSEVGLIIETLILNKPTGREKSQLLNQLFNETEGHHGLQVYRMLDRLYTWYNKTDRKTPFENDLTIETDAITSGFILTIMQILGDKASAFLSKGGIYNQEAYEKWTKYTQKWLAIKRTMQGKTIKKEDIIFGPASLIEAGNFHQYLIENPEEADKAKNAIFRSPHLDNTIMDNYKEEEVFQDLYKTIGIEMQEKVAKKKEENKQNISILKSRIAELKAINIEDTIDQSWYKKELNRYKIELNKALMIESMLASIGKITPKTLRSIAKDPVMVYIYGSQISTIRQKLGITVGVNEFIKALEISNKARLENTITEKSIKANNFINNTMAVYNDIAERNFNITNKNSELSYDQKYALSFSKYDTENGIINMDYKSIKDIPIEELYMNMQMDDIFIQILSDSVNETFGDAIEDAFDILDFVDEYRNEVKSIELITFELFKARTDVIRENILKKNGIITQKDFNQMLKTLEVNGYGHDSPDGSPNGYNNRLPLINLEKSSSSGQASVSIELNMNIIKNGQIDKNSINIQKRIYSYLNNKIFLANANGSSTVTIHRQDSNAITYTIDSHAWLSIYDAIVQASHPSNVKESTSAYNRTVFIENAGRDIRGDNLRKLNFMLNDLKKRMKSEDNQIKEDAIKEYKLFRSRLKTIEEAKSKEYTIKYKDVMSEKEIKKHPYANAEKKILVPTHKTIVSKENRTATLVQNNDVYSKFYIDIQEIEFKNGKKIIKEVHYPKVHTYPKQITRTMYKVIENDVMSVTEAFSETVNIKFTEMDKNGKRIQGDVDYSRAELNQKRKKLAIELKKYGKTDSEIKKEINKKFPITKRVAYKISYEIYGKENIENFNNHFETNNNFEIINLETTIIPLKNNNLINIISGKKEYNTDSIASKESIIFEGIPGNSDITNDMVRTGLPLESIIENISKINKKRKMKENSLTEPWWSAHSATSNTEPEYIPALNIKFDEININDLLKELNSAQIENEINTANYIQNKIEALKKENKEYNNQIDQNLELAEELLAYSGSKEKPFYSIGGSEFESINSAMKNANKYNHKYYNKNAIVAIFIFDNSPVVKANNNLASTYKNINGAVKSNAEILTYASSKRINEIMKLANLSESISSFDVENAIRRAINIDAYDKLPQQYQIEVNQFIINNKMKRFGYKANQSKNNKFIIWKPIKISYNKTTKLKNKDLVEMAKDFILKMKEC